MGGTKAVYQVAEVVSVGPHTAYKPVHVCESENAGRQWLDDNAAVGDEYVILRCVTGLLECRATGRTIVEQEEP